MKRLIRNLKLHSKLPMNPMFPSIDITKKKYVPNHFSIRFSDDRGRIEVDLFT